MNSSQRSGITQGSGDNAATQTLTNTALGISSIEQDDGDRTRYVRDPDGRMLGMITGGQRYNAATDAQNSTLALAEDGTDSSDPDVAYDYTPYGQTEATTAGSGGAVAGSNPFTYIGSYEFDNGDKAMGHRYMSHFTERFTQQDPSWQENNQYTYAGCDPVNNSDPRGLDYLSDVARYGTGFGMTAAAGGCVVGGVAGAYTGMPGIVAGGAGPVLGGAIGCGIGFGIGWTGGVVAGVGYAAYKNIF
ncbi:RHS repeat-associated protein [Haloactinospora alba]|uniref:RHS repeat-associated protein n=1 Tax=Haloactinospora alba TaxID=405555 RepID=A0A543N7A9_9ACTN|nr:RHS repeat-associated core domain-containing protein [Haloactinospora alba]TQN27709.1 RHS repeat-associated protein [Haloactinospora alba]